MEEKHEETTTDHNIPRMLNFNAPLLSTRRLVNPATLELSCTNLHSVSRNTSGRIPFSWEQAPGKPKDLDTSSHNLHEQDTPRPKLPPSWWRPPSDEPICDDQTDDNYCDDGWDGDVDDRDVDVFSDAIDVFSLSEAIDIVERSQNKVDAIDGLKQKLAECRGGDETPNFIIQRFLPDATALAASSALSLKYHPEASSDHQHGAVSTQSYSSPKGCGLEVFFPWRMKHKLCGVKSPVRHSSVTRTVQHQRHVQHKRHG